MNTAATTPSWPCAKLQDPVGPVDEDEPDGQEPVIEPGYRAFDDYRQRNRHLEAPAFLRSIPTMCLRGTQVATGRPC